MRGGDQLKYWKRGTSKAVIWTLSCVCLHRKLTGFQIAHTVFIGLYTCFTGISNIVNAYVFQTRGRQALPSEDCNSGHTWNAMLRWHSQNHPGAFPHTNWVDSEKKSSFNVKGYLLEKGHTQFCPCCRTIVTKISKLTSSWRSLSQRREKIYQRPRRQTQGTQMKATLHMHFGQVKETVLSTSTCGKLKCLCKLWHINFFS